MGVSYQRGLKTDQWRAGLLLERRFAGGVRVSFSELLVSDRLATVQEGDKWKDQIHGALWVGREIGPGLEIVAKGTQFRFRDQQAGTDREIRTHAATLGLDWRTHRFRLPLDAGIKEDRQGGRTDTGPMLATGLEIPEALTGEWSHQLLARANADWLDRRQNRTLDASYLVHRRFGGATEDSLLAQLLRQRRDYYLDASGLVESRDEQSVQVENRLVYELGRRSFLWMRTGMAWRRLAIHHVTDDENRLQRRRDDFSAQLDLKARFQGHRWMALVDFGLSGLDESYVLGDSQTPLGRTLATPDNQSQQSHLSALVGWRSGQDSLKVRARVERLRYDTPDQANVDDRDELRWRAEAAWIRGFSPWLKGWIRLVARGDHLVFLSGRRSADNQWTHALSLEPGMAWAPSDRFEWTQHAQVMANYVDYDFESQMPSLRSYLYRRLVVSDSVRYTLNHRVVLRASYRLELDENGKFLWDRWQEQRLLHRESHSFSLHAEIWPSPRWRISPGVDGYRRKGYKHGLGGTELASDFRHWGPALGLAYRDRGLDWSLYVQFNQTALLHQAVQRLTRVQLRCRWTL